MTGLRGLRKDNPGYDLKQYFICAVGTLGIITAATLRLSPLLRAKAMAFLATPSPATAVAWFRRVRLVLWSPVRRRSSPHSGENSTYRTVQIFQATSPIFVITNGPVFIVTACHSLGLLDSPQAGGGICSRP